MTQREGEGERERERERESEDERGGEGFFLFAMSISQVNSCSDLFGGCVSLKWETKPWVLSTLLSQTPFPSLSLWQKQELIYY